MALITWSKTVENKTTVDGEPVSAANQAAPAASVDWSNVLNTPTTLAGYGINETKANFNTALNDGSFLFVGDNLPWGDVTGKPTTLAGYGITGTKAEFDTALSDGNFLYVGDADDYDFWQLNIGVSQYNITSGFALEFAGGTGIDVSYLAGVVTITNTGADEYANAVTFATGTGVLSIGRAIGADLTTSLDGRYLLAANDEHANSLAFDTGTGVLTVGRAIGTDLTQSLDGRYAIGTFDNYSHWQLNVDAGQTNITSAFALEFAGGTGIDVSYAAGVVTITNNAADEYVNALTFATGTGNLTIGRLIGADIVENLDGRYLVDPAGTASQFIKGDGTLDSTTYAPAATTLAGYGISDTKANFDTALSDGNFLYVGDADDYDFWQLNIGVGSYNITSSFALEFAGGSNIDVTYAAGVVTIAQTAGTDEFLNAASFATGTGVLALGRNIGADVTVNLDGRYLQANQSITLSGDITGTGTTAITTAIGANKVTLAMMDQIATNRFLGRTTAGTGNVESLTAVQATALLNTFSTTTTTKGLVTGSNNLGLNYFLNGNGTWTIPTDNNSYVDAVTFANGTGVLTVGRNDGLADLTTNLDGRYLLIGNDEHATSLSFATGTGILTVNRNVGTALTVDLDGRYAIGTFDNYGFWTVGDGTTTANISSGTTLDFIGGTGITVSYAAGQMTITAAGGTDEYANALTFANGTGVLTIGRAIGADLTTSLDGRYVTTSGVTSVSGTGTVSGITLSGTVTTTGNLTLSGAVTGVTTATASTLVQRDGSADINARLFRSNYTNQTTISGAIAYRVNTSDNYIRFCSDMGAVRTFIDVPSRSGSGASGTWTINVTGSAATCTTAAASTRSNTTLSNTGTGNYYLVWSDQTASGTISSLLYRSAQFYIHRDNNRLYTTNLTASGDVSITGNLYAGNGQFYLDASSHRTGLLRNVETGANAYAGYETYFSSTAIWQLMSNQTTMGAYDDINNKWGWIFNENAGMALYHNASQKFTTSSTGITVTGSGSATDWVASSDRRLKTNIKYGESWLDRAVKIGGKVARYDWRSEEEGGKDNIGLIAQDVLKIAPEFVHTWKKLMNPKEVADADNMQPAVYKEYYGLEYGKLITPLYAAFAEEKQNKDEEIRKLKSRVLFLEKEIQTLNK